MRGGAVRLALAVGLALSGVPVRPSSSFIRNGRRYWQGSARHHQSTVISSTVFEATKLPLTRWFQAMHLLTQAKNNLSALDLMRHLGVCYKTALLMKHKLMEVMRLREDSRQLTGRVEIDDAYLGGERAGGKRGRGSENKVLSNLKTALAGTYHSFHFAKYAHRYLAEAQYRFNRRFDLAAILPRLLRAAAVTRPQPGRLLRAAEVGR